MRRLRPQLKRQLPQPQLRLQRQQQQRRRRSQLQQQGVNVTFFLTNGGTHYVLVFVRGKCFRGLSIFCKLGGTSAYMDRLLDSLTVVRLA